MTAFTESIVEDAVPGDIVGLYDPGALRIGDTLSVAESEKVTSDLLVDRLIEAVPAPRSGM